MSSFDLYKDVRVLITGGLGFIGSNIAHKLASYGTKVTVVDTLDPRYGGNLANVQEIRDQINLHVADYRNPSLLPSLVRDADIIFNLAGQVRYRESYNIPCEDLDLNCRGPLQLLEACRRYNPEARVVFASSRLVVGPMADQPIREDHAATPDSPYGIHKLAAEQYHKLYAEHYGLKTAVLRISNPYGERQQLKHHHSAIPGWFMRLALEGKPITIFGDGKQLRDYIHASDVADAFLAIAASDVPPGEIFNCGFGRSVPFFEMAETVVRVVKSGTIQYVPWPSDYPGMSQGDVHVNIDKLCQLTTWSPSVPLEEGIARMYQYFAPRTAFYFFNNS